MGVAQKPRSWPRWVNFTPALVGHFYIGGDNYALERMQVSYNGEHQQHPLLYPLVLANREELIEQGCTFKLKSADLLVLPR